MATATVTIVVSAASAAEWTALTGAGALVPRLESEVVNNLAGTATRNNSTRKLTLVWPTAVPTTP